MSETVDMDRSEPPALMADGRLPPGWDVTRVLRLLWSNVAALSPRGYVLTPDLAGDVVQSFYAKLMTDLLPRFDETRASFATFVSSEFRWFAKAALINASRWRRKREDYDAFRATLIGTGEAPADVVEQNELLGIVRTALTTLSPRERDVLMAYLESGSPSERDLADRFHVSRHEVRQTLAEAFGHVLSRSPRPPDINEQGWHIVQHLYEDGQTVEEAASALSIPLKDVRSMRDELLTRLSRGRARSSLRSHNTIGKDDMENEPVLKALKEAILSGAESRLAELASILRNHEAEVESAAGASDASKTLSALDFTEEEIARLAENPEWMSRVYELLATNADPAAELRNVDVKAAEEEDDRDLANVGLAFTRLLLTGLPAALLRWDRHFGHVPEVSREVFRSLLQRPDVARAEDVGQTLALRGLTPVSFLQAGDAVSHLLEELIEDGVLRSGQRILLAPHGEHASVAPRPDVVPFLEAATEIAYLTELDSPLDSQHRTRTGERSLTETASGLVSLVRSSAVLNWLLEVSRTKRFLFEGLRVTSEGRCTYVEELPRGGGIALLGNPQFDTHNYQHRWSADEVVKRSPEPALTAR